MVVHQHRRRRVRAGGVVLAVGVAVTVAALAACGGAADAGASSLLHQSILKVLADLGPHARRDLAAQ
ncbi:hypothetical protein, partial [Streptomyces sp. MT206]|uniref:hypothetical protein n=1 Tax=Streptomyces sp. MT206 TaxID=3031407 RepID=UPI002FC9A2B0